MEGYHRSVLLKEVRDALNIRDAWYLDATLGDGGHSIEIISRGGKVVGIDVDPQALGRVQKRLKDLGYSGSLGNELPRSRAARYPVGKVLSPVHPRSKLRGILRQNKIKLIQGNFRDLKNLISQTDTKDWKFAGAIFDLGVSSLQLETPERGFSFMKNGPLDMRMDPALAVRALDLVNALSRKELYGLFNQLGEEKNSWALANSIISAREVMPITTTSQLVGIAENSTHGRRAEIHPATRIFQALRIAVNDELGALQEGLDQVIDLIEKNGAILVISFHSLEDRIVKFTFKKWADLGLGEVVTDKPTTPKDEEIEANPRSRSAKMRVFKKL